jgi:hypothetical protein
LKAYPFQTRPERFICTARDNQEKLLMRRVVLEPAYWRSVIGGAGKEKIPVFPYLPRRRETPSRELKVNSAWNGIPNILADIIERFHLKTDRCLEFGVEFGFSTVALSSYFDSVIGVDTFVGDKHSGNREDIYEQTRNRLLPYPNISLIQSNYREFILGRSEFYDLIHVDIVHTFADTFACGLWSAEHSQCTIFHDTESFPAVKQAVIELAKVTGKQFYNFRECFGLGILV